MAIAAEATPAAIGAYAVPSGWTVTTIGELFDIQQGKALSPRGRTASRRFPFLRTANVLWGKLDLAVVDQMGLSSEERERLRLKQGDLLVCEGGEIGRAALWTGKLDECYYQNHIHRLRPRDARAFPEFYMYWLQLAFTRLQVYEGAGTKTTIANLSQGRLARLEVPVPPLDEQRRIAQILSTILTARNSATTALAAARVLKNSALRSLLHEGLATQSGEVVKTAVGQIPANWHVKRLGELFEVQLGKMLSPKAKAGRNPQPYLRNQDVQWGRINTSGLATMDFGERELSKFELRPGDVLVCEGGEVGRAAIWRGAAGSCYYQKALHRLRPLNGEMDPEFLAYQLMDAFLISKVHGDVTTTTTIAHLPAVKLRALPVPVPPIEEQRRIVAVLTSLDRDIECRSKELKALGVLFDSAVAELFESAK